MSKYLACQSTRPSHGRPGPVPLRLPDQAVLGFWKSAVLLPGEGGRGGLRGLLPGLCSYLLFLLLERRMDACLALFWKAPLIPGCFCVCRYGQEGEQRPLVGKGTGSDT